MSLRQSLEKICNLGRSFSCGMEKENKKRSIVPCLSLRSNRRNKDEEEEGEWLWGEEEDEEEEEEEEEEIDREKDGEEGIVAGDSRRRRRAWGKLLPELLVDIIGRVDAREEGWPGRRNVVACAAVCRRWREVTRALVRPPTHAGIITFPSSLKQETAVSLGDHVTSGQP